MKDRDGTTLGTNDFVQVDEELVQVAQVNSSNVVVTTLELFTTFYYTVRS